jgi:hypothetical protein
VSKKLVIIESPYNGNWFIRHRNIKYARRCMLDSLQRGEAPFLSHLLYTQVLNEKIYEQRNQGIIAGLCWGNKSDKTIVYKDYGYSSGMRFGKVEAAEHNRPIEERLIGKNPSWFSWLKIGRNEDER